MTRRSQVQAPRPTRRILALALLAALLPAAEAAAQPKQVALTFDDGPSSNTPSILRTLKRERVRATFFVVGSNVGGNETLVRRMVKRGHEVGNHTWSHPWLTEIPLSDVARELGRTSRIIGSAAAPAGGGRPDLFRPPGALVNSRIRAIAREKGMRTVLWDVNPKDYFRPGAGALVRRTLEQMRRRSIVLLHDSLGPGDQTVAALPRMISELEHRGYEFVTVSKLLRSGPYEPHVPGFTD